MAARIVARLLDRTGSWQATFGKTSDQGGITIRFRCTGGGNLTVGAATVGMAGETSATNACDGNTKLFAETGDAPSGTMTITVKPDGDQRWSLLVARGPVEPGSEWPKDAPEIQPSS